MAAFDFYTPLAQIGQNVQGALGNMPNLDVYSRGLADFLRNQQFQQSQAQQQGQFEQEQLMKMAALSQKPQNYPNPFETFFIAKTKGKPMAQITPDEMAGISKEWNAMMVEQVGGAAKAREVAKRELPPEPKVLPADQATSLATFDNLLSTAQELKDMIETGGGNKVIGPIDYPKAAALATITPQETYTKLSNKLGKLIETAYALSGKQISEREMKMLETKFLPNMLQPEKNFKITLGEFMNWLKEKRDSRYQVYEDLGYDMSELKKGQWTETNAAAKTEARAQAMPKPSAKTKLKFNPSTGAIE